MNASHLPILKLHLTPRLGRAAIFKLQRRFGDFESALAASARDWQEAGVSEQLRRNIPADSDPHYRKIRDQLTGLKVRIVSFWDHDYPPELRTIHDPPALLYLRGSLTDGDAFAIVGSRRATAAGLATTRSLAAQLAQHDICIVSGLARGVDSAAHRGALDVEGRTVAVLGCGIDRIYPRENRRLFHEILERNAIISEYPPGTAPLAGHFPGRNRIISGLSKGVLVVEAAEGSGSLITGDFALEQGRELFAVPGPPHLDNSRGANRLLKDGAGLVTEADDILQALWPGRTDRRERLRQDSFSCRLSETAAKVYRILGFEPIHSDEIARKCGLTPMELSAILLDLELQGGIKALPGHHYVRSRM